jgi:lipoate-protein ligase A
VLGISQRRVHADVEQRLGGRAQAMVRDSGGGAVLAGPWMVGASIALPHGHPWLAGGLVDSYRPLAQLHVDVLAQCGVTGHAVSPQELPRRRADNAARGSAAVDWACFGGLSPWEVVDADGRKLVGLAQTRRRNGVLLVAGTLVDVPEWSLLCEAMGRPHDEAALRRCTVACTQIAGERIEAARFASLLVRALALALDSGTERDGAQRSDPATAADPLRPSP